MLIELDSRGGAVLRDPENFGQLKVILPQDVGDDIVDMSLRSLGRVSDGHVWIPQHWFLANGPADANWARGLSSMLSYASSKGWTDAGGSVRVHVERA